jgi:hypothetical protein
VGSATCQLQINKNKPKDMELEFPQQAAIRKHRVQAKGQSGQMPRSQMPKNQEPTRSKKPVPSAQSPIARQCVFKFKRGYMIYAIYHRHRPLLARYPHPTREAHVPSQSPQEQRRPNGLQQCRHWVLGLFLLVCIRGEGRCVALLSLGINDGEKDRGVAFVCLVLGVVSPFLV